MKILLVVEPGVDGAFRHVEGLAHYLVGQGEQVHLAYSTRRDSEALHQLLHFVESHGGRCLDLRVGNSPEPRDVRALLRLRRLARQVRPDIIHGHSSKAGALVRPLKLLGVPAHFFYTPHAYYGLTPRPGIKSRVFNATEKALGRVGTTINISPDESRFAKDTLGIAADHIRTIHNPVDTAFFEPPNAALRQQRREALGLPPDALVLGTMGRVSFQKDPETLYRAIAPLLHAEPRLRLLHVGQGELDESLRELAASLGIEGQLIRHDYLDQPLAFHQAVDALILTSRYEAGWPLVMLEALSCDVPVIVSTAPGTTDIQEAGLSHCWTAEPGDVDGFTGAAEQWLEDLPSGRRINHRELAAQRFSVEKCFGAVLAAYREELGKVSCRS